MFIVFQSSTTNAQSTLKENNIPCLWAGIIRDRTDFVYEKPKSICLKGSHYLFMVRQVSKKFMDHVNRNGHKCIVGVLYTLSMLIKYMSLIMEKKLKDSFHCNYVLLSSLTCVFDYGKETQRLFSLQLCRK